MKKTESKRAPKMEEEKQQAPQKPKLEYEKPELSIEVLSKAAKAFAVKSGMGSC